MYNSLNVITRVYLCNLTGRGGELLIEQPLTGSFVMRIGEMFCDRFPRMISSRSEAGSVSISQLFHILFICTCFLKSIFENLINVPLPASYCT